MHSQLLSVSSTLTPPYHSSLTLRTLNFSQGGELAVERSDEGAEFSARVPVVNPVWNGSAAGGGADGGAAVQPRRRMRSILKGGGTQARDRYLTSSALWDDAAGSGSGKAGGEEAGAGGGGRSGGRRGSTGSADAATGSRLVSAGANGGGRRGSANGPGRIVARGSVVGSTVSVSSVVVGGGGKVNEWIIDAPTAAMPVRDERDGFRTGGMPSSGPPREHTRPAAASNLESDRAPVFSLDFDRNAAAFSGEGGPGIWSANSTVDAMDIRVSDPPEGATGGGGDGSGWAGRGGGGGGQEEGSAGEDAALLFGSPINRGDFSPLGFGLGGFGGFGGGGGTSTFRLARVLLAEDDKLVRQMASMLFQIASASCEVVSTGLELFARLAADPDCADMCAASLPGAGDGGRRPCPYFSAALL